MANSDSGQYRLLVAETGNINDSLCRIVSNAVNLTLQCPLENQSSTQDAVEEQATSLRIFPNPNTGTFHFSFFVESKQQITCKVWHITGKQVWDESVAITRSGAQELAWKAHPLPAGVYFLAVYQEEKVEVKRLVIH